MIHVKSAMSRFGVMRLSHAWNNSAMIVPEHARQSRGADQRHAKVPSNHRSCIHVYQDACGGDRRQLDGFQFWGNGQPAPAHGQPLADLKAQLATLQAKVDALQERTDAQSSINVSTQQNIEALQQAPAEPAASW